MRGRARKEISIQKAMKLRRGGATLKEISIKLGCSVNTLKSRLGEAGIYTTDRVIFKEYECTDWDKSRELTKEDIEFLEKYNLRRFNK